MIITYIVTAASIIGTVANVYQKRWCFIIWILTNCFWCVYDALIGQYAQTALFAVYFMLAIAGLVKWRKRPKARTKDNDPWQSWKEAGIIHEERLP